MTGTDSPESENFDTDQSDSQFRFQRSPHALQFYAALADRIVRTLEPATTLHVGCGSGTLVDALRRRGVEAYGIEPSMGTDEGGQEPVSPYCETRSLSIPLSRRYGLILALDGLPAASNEEIQAAVSTLCAASDDVVLAPGGLGPDGAADWPDGPDPWVRAFTEHGFLRDVTFDASLFGSHAMRFRRDSQRLTDIVAGYELILWKLSKQLVPLRELAMQNRKHTVADLEQQITDIKLQIGERERQLADKTSAIEALRSRLEQRRRTHESALQERDRDFVRLQRELAAARTTIGEVQGTVRKLNGHIDVLRGDIARQNEVILRLREQIGNLNAQEQRLGDAIRIRDEHWAMVQSTLGYRLVDKVQNARNVVAPRGSRRERLWFWATGRQVPACTPEADAAPGSGEKETPLIAESPSAEGQSLQSQTAAQIHDEVQVQQPVSALEAAPTPASRPSASTEAEGTKIAAYRQWIRDWEPTPDDLAAQCETSRELSYRPLISIVIPVYNPSLDLLRAAIDSVRGQTYDRWQLCIADGGSTDSDVRELLGELLADDRIAVELLHENRGIAENTNAALALAAGEFVALLDQDDTLAPFALYEVAAALNDAEDTDVLYSDHDVLSADGTNRSSPLFKPDWSPETMLSANYITHLTVLRTDLVRSLGGLSAETDGAQDWDLFLRISEVTARIRHIPKVLYHWRDTGSSTARDIARKPYALRHQLSVISSHLDRIGLRSGQAFLDRSGYIRVRWQRETDPLVSIIIPSRGADEMLRRCLESLLMRTQYANYEILIVNNGAERPERFPLYASLSTDARVRVLHFDAPFNYSAVNNFGAREVRGSVLLFLNNDTEITEPDWLDELVQWATRKEIGVVGARLLKPDGSIQHAGVVIGMGGFAGHIFAGARHPQLGIFGLDTWYRNYCAVTGACMMVRRDVFEEMDGFDEEFLLCGSDVDLCLHVRERGYRVVYDPFAQLRHIESATHRGNIPAQDFIVSSRRYPLYLEEGDPYFNRNLSYWSLEPRLKRIGEEEPVHFVHEYVRTLDSSADRAP